MSNQELFSKVKALSLSSGKYVLFGSAPMGVRGLKDCHDADILITEDEWNKYRDKPEWIPKVGLCGDDYFENGEIGLWKNLSPGKWDVQKLIDDAEIIDGLPFVRLKNVIEWKKLYAREKDLKDIEIIENFLKAEK
jgi:hypothetical protein